MREDNARAHAHCVSNGRGCAVCAVSASAPRGKCDYQSQQGFVRRDRRCILCIVDCMNEFILYGCGNCEFCAYCVRDWIS